MKFFVQILFYFLLFVFAITKNLNKQTSFSQLPELNLRSIFHSENERILQNKSKNAVYVFKLYGNSSLAYYFTNLYVGTPPQRQSVITDTGSSLTTFPCSDIHKYICEECKQGNCGSHIDQKFNLDQSKTSQILKCRGQNYLGNYNCRCGLDDKCMFSISYTEHSSLEGFLIYDQLTLNLSTNSTTPNQQFKQVNYAFGCTTKEENLFKTQQADGILGLGIRSNSSREMPNIIDYFYKSGSIKQPIFSLCYELNGGYMTIGGFNHQKHFSDSKIYQIPISRKQSLQYNINIHNVKINSEQLDLTLEDFDQDQGSFLDSGTTLFYANPTFLNAFLSLIIKKLFEFCEQDINARCGGNPLILHNFEDKCLEWNPQELEKLWEQFPDIEFELDNGVTYLWPPKYYIYEDQPKQYCIGIQQIPGRVILGGIFFRGREFLFDKQNEVVYFVDANCTVDSDIGYSYDDHNLMIPSPITKHYITSKNKLRKQQYNQGIVALLLIAVIIALILIFRLLNWLKKKNILNLNQYRNVSPDSNNESRIEIANVQTQQIKNNLNSNQDSKTQYQNIESEPKDDSTKLKQIYINQQFSIIEDEMEDYEEEKDNFEQEEIF